ncbi:non-ribosomal peptide synthetase [Streptomyces sp. NRRL S-920]|uniref:non-ribosomal peptide synthetase n=1 Tax=Streptomyces sp. NRRL S-920 TaxID=1463921 RepID=UPI0004C9C416|nr:non-ribosomal peptide synthetase [Streptomyces sp. NRRL S-920]
MHELFEEQSARTPDATALVYEGERLTYAELDARAARLAGLLAARGVRRGDTVGVYLERSAELAVAVLGTLKAGAGYVMLDPGFPAGRLRGMAADAGIAAVLTSAGAGLTRAGATEEPPEFVDDVPVLHVEDAAHAQPLARGAVAVRPDDVACVMFTSGSTGRPKGIVAPHRAVTATLTGQDYASFGPGAVWLQCAPVSWDAFALELWGPLLGGGTCVLHPGRRPDPVVIARLVAAHGITSMYLSASLFNVIVDEYPRALTGLRELIVGGEALSPPHVARALERAPGLRLGNGYGPVECMVFLTVHPITPQDVRDGRPVPIGRPLAGKRLYVLDERLRPVADGVTGELYAAGAGVARGYSDASLTAERFVATPPGLGRPGERMYRTGDLARRRADGTFEYLGRSDSQVKIRGFRVEPGEVEAALARHPGVERVAVVATRAAADGERQLVAYLVPGKRGEQAPTAAELRVHAERELAEFLVPAAFVVLDALPLTANGKLDRAALPEPARAASEEPRPGAGDAQSETVRALCALFADVLGVASVGPHDDFFVLGGHSLLAARVLGRVHAALGAELDLRTLFEAATPAGLAPHVDGAAKSLPPSRTSPPGGSAPLPVSPAQHRLWFLDRLGAGVAYNLPVLVRLRGEVDPDALADALGDVVARHDVLRTVFDEVDGAPVRRVLSGVDARPPFRHLTLAEGELVAAVEDAARHRFDLRGELPVRGALFSVRDRPDEHALLVLIHHIAGDGWSLAPLFRDLSRAYATRAVSATGAEAEGRGTLPPLPVTYAEHARRQADRLGPPDDPASLAARQLAYWTRTLTGAGPEGPLLPRRPDRPAVPGPAAATLVRRLDAAAHARLVDAARDRGATLFMALHTALAAVLVRAGAGEDLAIGAPVAGRAGDGSVEDAVGFFVNMLVLRTDVSGDPGARQLLARVREADLAAFAHQDVPFEQVVGALKPPRTRGRQPFTDVVLALQNNARAEVDLPGADAGVEVVRTGEARFELLVDVTDTTGPGGSPEGLTLTFEYRAASVEAPFMEWLADALPQVLQALPRALDTTDGAPDTPVSALVPAGPPRRADAGDRIAAPAVTRAAGPVTPLERDIAAVWSDVLGVPDLGRDDDFFALGGNSLRAVRVAARLTTGARTVTAAQLFTAPTVAALAAELARAPMDQGPAPAPIPRRPRVPRQQDQQSHLSREQEERPWTSA